MGARVLLRREVPDGDWTYKIELARYPGFGLAVRIARKHRLAEAPSGAHVIIPVHMVGTIAREMETLANYYHEEVIERGGVASL